MFDVAQKQDGADEMTVAIFERRRCDADGDLLGPASDEITLAPGPLLAWRMGSADQVDEP